MSTHNPVRLITDRTGSDVITGSDLIFLFLSSSFLHFSFFSSLLFFSYPFNVNLIIIRLKSAIMSPYHRIY